MRRHLTYANVMATAAVFIALGGSSYAAVQLSKDSVRSKHIKNGQVKGPDLATNAVNTRSVKNGSLLSSDFKAGQAPAGARGDRGLTGLTGTSGVSGYVICGPGPCDSFGTYTMTTNPNTTAEGAVYCPAGKRALGGGPSFNSDPAATFVTRSGPTESGAGLSGWSVQVRTGGNGMTAGLVSVRVICATVSD